MLSAHLLALLVAAPPAPTWDAEYEYDGVRVWVRQIEGSSIHDVKAEIEVDVPALAVWSVIDDTPSYHEFMPYIAEIRVVAAETGTHYEYTRVDPPLIAQRDYSARILREVDEELGVYRRAWVIAEQVGPPPCDGCVRVARCDGSWIVEALGPARSRLRYRIHMDPGGRVPAWFANLAHRRGISNVMHSVATRTRELLEGN